MHVHHLYAAIVADPSLTRCPAPHAQDRFCWALQQHQHKYTPTGYAHTNTHMRTHTLGRVINSL